MEVSLVYPHQLFSSHPAVKKGRAVYLIEDPLFFGNDPHWPCAMHVQKLVLHRASMRAYATSLEGEVNIIECPDGADTDSAALLEQAVPTGATVIHLCDVEDDVLRRRIERFAYARGIELVISPSPNFLTPPDFIAKYTAGEKRASMARFLFGAASAHENFVR